MYGGIVVLETEAVTGETGLEDETVLEMVLEETGPYGTGPYPYP